MNRRLARSVLVALLAFGLPTPAIARAQLAWETPRMLGPSAPAGLGAYWLRAGTLPGDGDALLVTWDAPGLPDGVSIRGAAGTGAGGEAAAFGGIDLQRPLARRGPDRPIDLAWTTGAGIGIGESVLITLPLGLSAGRTWAAGSVWLSPYVGLGLAMDLRLGDDLPGDEFQVTPSADLGLDMALDRDRRVVVRSALSLGDRQAIAVGVAVTR